MISAILRSLRLFEAVLIAFVAASSHEFGLVPTSSIILFLFIMLVRLAIREMGWLVLIIPLVVLLVWGGMWGIGYLTGWW